MTTRSLTLVALVLSASACNLVLGNGLGVAPEGSDGATEADASSAGTDSALPSGEIPDATLDSPPSATSDATTAPSDDAAIAPIPDSASDAAAPTDARIEASADSGGDAAPSTDAAAHDAGHDSGGHATDAATGIDASGPDSSAPPDAGSTGSSDASAAPDAATAYSDMTNAALWSTHDLSAIVGNANAGYAGSAFDGTYLYLIPLDSASTGSIVARYDTRLPFDANASWTSFDTRSIAGAPAGFFGAAFDGRYLYLVPGTSSSIPQGVAVRFDTTLPFSQTASWSSFDATQVDPNAKGFAGGVSVNPTGVPGHGVIYFVPFSNVPGGSGLTVVPALTTYDPSLGDFTNSAAWSTLNLAPISSALLGETGLEYIGGVYDGRWVYLLPSYRVAMRHDTRGLLDAGWQAVDTVAIPVTPPAGYATGFHGGVSDGTFVYSSPCYGTGGAAPAATVMRFNTTANFTVPSDFQTFDISSVGSKGYCGAAFDGRYVYFVPTNNGSYFGLAVRYDTTTSFTAPASWTKFDLATKDPAAVGYYGAAFDGRYVYMVPYGSHLVARFDAKSPAGMPAGMPGSLF